MCAKINKKLDYHYQGNTEDTVFFKMPKILFLGDEFKDLSMSAKLLYMLLLDRVSMSSQNNWVDKDNKVFIYYTQNEVMKKLNFSSKKVSNLFKELENVFSENNGIIKRVKQGLRKPDLIYVKDLSSIEVKDTSFDGDFKYSRPNIENKIDVKSDEVLSLENKIKLLEKEVAKSHKTLELKRKVENSINVINNVENDIENPENKDLIIDLTSKNDKSRDVKNTTLDLSKLQPINNNINKTNFIDNNSFIHSANEESTGMNERMINKQFKLNIINEMYENKELPYLYTASEIKMNVAIKELVSYDIAQTNFRNKTIDELEFSIFKLFTNALIGMLTSKTNMTLNSQNVTYFKVYDRLTEYISFEEDEFCNTYCHLNNLVDNAMQDYKRGSLQTQIKNPQKYMQACIWNALHIGDIHMQTEINSMMNDVELINGVIDKIKIKEENKTTSYNLQEVENMWNNNVPR